MTVSSPHAGWRPGSVIALAALALIAGAARAASLAPAPGTPAAAPEAAADRRGQDASIGGLPASFAGRVPCPDCAGIRIVLQLLPGGAWMQRTTSLRTGHDDSVYQLGTWSMSSDGRTLVLSGPQGSVYWAVDDPRTLRRLDAVGNPIASNDPGKLTRAAGFDPIEPRLRLVGYLRWNAGAARFRDCATELEWPVAAGDDQPALARAYAAQAPAPGADLLVSLEGRIEPRGGGGGATLVVEKFLRAMPGRSCEDRRVRAELAHTRWRPVRIGDRAVATGGPQKEAWIQLDPASRRITGSGGCNRVGGSYESGNGTLRFGPLISTRMICSSMSTEVAFFKALDATRRYRLMGNMLELLDDRGRLLARLEERSPR